MTNAHSIIRSLIIYAICIPLAIYVGYLLTGPLSYRMLMTFGLLGTMLFIPILLKCHYPIMLFGWNLGAVLFFLPVRPPFWLAAVGVSFVLSLTQRILNKNVRPVKVPELSRPLFALALVVIMTALMTGGIGFRLLGGETYGGKRYAFLLFGILGYFALAAQRIPREKATLYTALFFFGGVTCIIGDLFSVVSPGFRYIFLLFPVYSLGGAVSSFSWGESRLPGATATSWALFCFMLAKYGARGLFLTGRPWRLGLLVAIMVFGMFGGFRSLLINFIATLGFACYLEKIHRTRLFPFLAVLMILIGIAMLPLASYFPMTVQRSLAFLPESVVELDPVARQNAESSSEWRIQMWRDLLPSVPQHLLLGKGLGISRRDYASMGETTDESRVGGDQWNAALAGDYHNGPLSVILPFGLWGVLAFIWFLVAAAKVLHANYRYGDPELRTINAFLYASFLSRILMFFFVVGGLYSDIQIFVGTIGLSVALNGGIARRPQVVSQKIRSQEGKLGPVLPPHPAMGRASG